MSESETMRRRWVIEVHQTGKAITHVSNGERVHVFDDVGKASEMLDTMQSFYNLTAYKLVAHYCYCAPDAERDALALELTEASHRNLTHLAAIRELGASLDEARAQRHRSQAEVYRLSGEQRQVRDRSDLLDDGEQVAHLTKERDAARGERDSLKSQLTALQTSLREERSYESRLRAEINLMAAQRELAEKERDVAVAARGVDFDRYVELMKPQPLLAARKAVAAAHVAYDVARNNHPAHPSSGYDAPVAPPPVTVLDHTEVLAEARDKHDREVKAMLADIAFRVLGHQSVGLMDRAEFERVVRKLRDERTEAGNHVEVLIAERTDAMAHLGMGFGYQHTLAEVVSRALNAAQVENEKLRADCRRLTDELAKLREARSATREAQVQASIVEERDVDREVGRAEDEPLAEIDKLRAQVETQLKALAICDQWIKERDQSIAALRSEADERAVQQAALEARLHNCQKVARGLADEVNRQSERPLRALARRFRLARPSFAEETAVSCASANVRAAHLFEDLRAAETERDHLRVEAEGLRAAAEEAQLANYREERPALYAEVARLQALDVERRRDADEIGRLDAEVLRLRAVLKEHQAEARTVDAYEPGELLWTEMSFVHDTHETTEWADEMGPSRIRYASAEGNIMRYEYARLRAEVERLREQLAEREHAATSTGYEPGQFLWNELHEDDSTTTWRTTTADRKRYARAERFLREWGYHSLRERMAASDAAHLAEVERLRGAFAEQDLKIAKLSDSGVRQPLISADEAALRAEIERLRDVFLKDAARGRSVGAPTPAGKRVWACKVLWGLDSELPGGADGPMRVAVEEAFRTLTGRWPDMVFSGWGGQLTEAELRCVEQQESRQVPEASRH